MCVNKISKKKRPNYDRTSTIRRKSQTDQIAINRKTTDVLFHVMRKK